MKDSGSRDRRTADRRVPGSLRFIDPAERYETRIRAARLLVRIARDKGEAVDPQVAADAARLLPGEPHAE